MLEIYILVQLRVYIELHIQTKIANKFIAYTRESIIINWHPHNQQQK